MSIADLFADSIPPKNQKGVIKQLLVMIPIIGTVAIGYANLMNSIRLQDERITRLENWRSDTDKSLHRLERNIARIGIKLGVEMENPE